MGLRPTSFSTAQPAGYESDNLVIEVREGTNSPGALLTSATFPLSSLYGSMRSSQDPFCDEVRFSPPVFFNQGDVFWMVAYPSGMTYYPRPSGFQYWDTRFDGVADGYASGDYSGLAGNSLGTLQPWRHHTVTVGPVYHLYPSDADPYIDLNGPAAGWQVDSPNTVLPSRVYPRRDPIAFRYNGKLYVMGGVWDHTVLHDAVALGGGAFYTYGGYDLTNRHVEVYDPALDPNIHPESTSSPWTTLGNMPDVRITPMFGVSGDQLYVAGGSKIVDATASDITEIPTASVYAYDLTTDVWTAATSLPFEMFNASFWTYNGLLSLTGGTRHTTTTETDVFTYSGGSGGTWTGVPQTYASTQGGLGGNCLWPWTQWYGTAGDQQYGGLVDSLNRVYLFPFGSGFTGSGFVRYDPSTQLFTQLGEIPHTHGSDEVSGNRQVHHGGRLITSDDRVWLFDSGYAATAPFSGAVTYTQEVWVYDPATDVWSQVSDTPEFGFGPYIQHSDGFIYFFGLSHIIWQYDIALDTWADSGVRLAAYDDLPQTITGGSVALTRYVTHVIPVADGTGGAYWLVYPRASNHGTGATDEGRGSVDGAATAVEYWAPGGTLTTLAGHSTVQIIG